MRAVIQRLDGTDFVFLILTVVCLTLAAAGVLLLTGTLSDIAVVLAGILAGAFITLLVTRYYSRQASHQLEEQAEELRKHVGEEVDQLGSLMFILARYMQKDELLKDVKSDDKGRLTSWAEHTLTGGTASYPRPEGPTPTEGAAEPEGAEPRPGTGDAQEGPQRPWWRVFGG